MLLLMVIISQQMVILQKGQMLFELNLVKGLLLIPIKIQLQINFLKLYLINYPQME